jgi:hypothetical protein
MTFLLLEIIQALRAFGEKKAKNSWESPGSSLGTLHVKSSPHVFANLKFFRETDFFYLSTETPEETGIMGLQTVKEVTSPQPESSKPLNKKPIVIRILRKEVIDDAASFYRSQNILGGPNVLLETKK